MRDKYYISILLALSVFLGGCATCTGDPYSDPTSCMFNKETLDAWVADKRMALSKLDARLVSLDSDLDSTLDEVLRLERDLRTAEVPEKELLEINDQIAKLKQRANQLSDQVIRHEIESKKLAEGIENASATDEELAFRITEEQEKVSDVEKDIQNLVEEFQHLNRQALSRS